MRINRSSLSTDPASVVSIEISITCVLPPQCCHALHPVYEAALGCASHGPPCFLPAHGARTPLRPRALTCFSPVQRAEDRPALQHPKVCSTRSPSKPAITRPFLRERQWEWECNSRTKVRFQWHAMTLTMGMGVQLAKESTLPMARHDAYHGNQSATRERKYS